MKKYLLILVALLPIALFGQNTTETAVLSDANIILNSNGVMFSDYANGLPGYEVPAGSNNNSVFAAAIWIGGLDSNDNLHLAGETYCQDNPTGFCEFFPGPLKTDGSASTTTDVQGEYNHFWHITRAEVTVHQAYFDCLNDPDCNTDTEYPSGYMVPTEILEWPTHGNTNEGYSANLAPFVDYNGNGIYDPAEGDYPSFNGDQAYYLISNDNGGAHTQSQGTPLGIEIHSLFYYYLSDDPALRATMFVHQDFINRSDTNYHDVYLGIFNDFDLGNPSDDYIATDVENSYVYVYNGDGTDEPSVSGPGYGTDIPMMACKILAGPYLDPNGMDDPGLYEGTQEYGDYTKGWNDGVIDNERMGLSSSIYFANAPGPTGDPTFSFDYYSYLMHTWLNGVPFRFGGTGYNPSCQSCATAKYIYPGESDPLFFGTNGIDPGYMTAGGWSEPNESTPAGDRRINANCGPFTLNAGQSQSLDYVYVFARQSDNPGEDLHDILTNHVQIAAATPDSLPVGVVSSVGQVEPEQIGFGLYPNPAGDAVTINLSGNAQASYRMYNILGAQVSGGLLQGGATIIDIAFLEHGLYLVNITIGDRSATRKLVVE